MKKLRITLNGISYEVDVEILEDDEEGLVHSYGHPAMTMPHPAPQTSRPGGERLYPRPVSKSPSSDEDQHILTSPIAGVVRQVEVSVGTVIQEHEPVLVMEAMNMNTHISSPISGKVREIAVKAGDAVQHGQVLLIFE